MFRFKQFLSEGKKRKINLQTSAQKMKPFYIGLPSPEIKDDEWEDVYQKILWQYQRDSKNSTSSSAMNNFLRKKPDFMTNPDDDQMHERISHLDRLFAKHGRTLDKPFTVFRGTSNVESGIHPAFLSTTLDRSLAYDFAAKHERAGRSGKVLKLTVPKGTPFVKINPDWGDRTIGFNKENEILFPRNTQLDINPKPTPTIAVKTSPTYLSQWWRESYPISMHRGIIRSP